MAQMFCTLKQAADRLQTTEAQIETMLNDGLLREFRDGSSRLLKVADLAGVVATSCPSTGSRRPACIQRKAGSARPTHVNRMLASFDTEIRLPAAPAAIILGDSPRVTATKRPARRTRPVPASRKAPHPARKPVCAKPRQRPPRAVVISGPATPQLRRRQTLEMSLRQWLWTGLLDDSPLAIFIVFGTVLLAACALAGAAYLLAQAL
jgi:hypothetical protein